MVQSFALLALYDEYAIYASKQIRYLSFFMLPPSSDDLDSIPFLLFLLEWTMRLKFAFIYLIWLLYSSHCLPLTTLQPYLPTGTQSQAESSTTEGPRWIQVPKTMFSPKNTTSSASGQTSSVSGAQQISTSGSLLPAQVPASVNATKKVCHTKSKITHRVYCFYSYENRLHIWTCDAGSCMW